MQHNTATLVHVIRLHDFISNETSVRRNLLQNGVDYDRIVKNHGSTKLAGKRGNFGEITAIIASKVSISFTSKSAKHCITVITPR